MGNIHWASQKLNFEQAGYFNIGTLRSSNLYIHIMFSVFFTLSNDIELICSQISMLCNFSMCTFLSQQRNGIIHMWSTLNNIRLAQRESEQQNTQQKRVRNCMNEYEKKHAKIYDRWEILINDKWALISLISWMHTNVIYLIELMYLSLD